MSGRRSASQAVRLSILCLMELTFQVAMRICGKIWCKIVRCNRAAIGAGHDAGIMAKLCPSGMIFLRCRDGVSHNPAESITVADADLGVRALLEAVRRLDRRLGA